MKTYYSNGKLLITGEYLVLDGALSLAIPTTYGQSLIVESIKEPKLIWESFDELNNVWFKEEFKISKNGILLSGENENGISQRLLQILTAAITLNPNFLTSEKGYKVTTKLNFPKNWGLGTSSTLINNIANWADVDSYQLLNLTFSGSGYDIACAQHNYPITYQLKNNKQHVTKVVFEPSYSKHLYFVYLNRKQNSREGISHYKLNNSNLTTEIAEVAVITQQIIQCQKLDEFEDLINRHESIISKIIKQEPIKDVLFNDFEGSIKSLGAWGGDFVLATSKSSPEAYFKSKGFDVVIPFTDMKL